MKEKVKYLDPRELYNLKGNEVVLFSMQVAGLPRNQELPLKQIMKDPDMKRIGEEAVRVAREIEDGPVLCESGSMGREMQGLYRDIRIAIKRDPVRGHLMKGMTLIGVPR